MLSPNFQFSDLNKGFVIAINIDAKENEGDAVAAILEDLVRPTMAEPGVKIFIPYRSPSNPLEFFLFELYENEDAWTAHQETSHFREAVDALLPLVTRRDRVPFVPYIAF